MSTTTLFPDDDIHDTAEDWKDSSDAAPSESERIPKRERPPVNHRMMPKPYQNGTLPSRTAAESARKFVSSQAKRLLDYLRSAGDRGATDKEMQTDLAMDGNSQRPRRVWLRNHGYVKAKGEPEDIVLRNAATVWVLTSEGLAAATKAEPSPADHRTEENPVTGNSAGVDSP